MTGGEILGGAAAVGNAAGKALSSSAAEEERLADIARDSPAMAAAADAYAKRLALKQAVLLKIFAPLARLVGVQREYFETTFAEDLAQKTDQIPDKDLRTPQASVAVPAMQGLGYSLDEPDLKDMYLSLLATAADGRREGEAHPSFAEIIKQLAAEEAAVLIDILTLGIIPAMEVRASKEGEASYKVASPPYVLGLLRNANREPYIERDLSVWIDNWVRLGLIVVHFDRSLSQDNVYDWCENHPTFIDLRDSASVGSKVTFQKGLIRTTDFGSRFRSAVSPRIGGTTEVHHAYQPVPVARPTSTDASR